MSIKQQLRDSGLFEEHPSQKDGSIRFEVIGWRYASVYVQKDDREVHITVGAFTAIGRGRFGNINDELHEYVRSHSHCFAHGSNNNRAYKLSSEFISGLIEIIASGI